MRRYPNENLTSTFPILLSSKWVKTNWNHNSNKINTSLKSLAQSFISYKRLIKDIGFLWLVKFISISISMLTQQMVLMRIWKPYRKGNQIFAIIFFLNGLGLGIHTTYYLSSWKAFWHPSWEAIFYLKISRFRTWNFGQFEQISDGPPLPRQKPRLDKLCFSISLMAFWFHWIIPGLPIPPLYMYIEHPEEEKALLKTQSIKGDNQSTNSVCCKSSDATVDSSQAFLWFSLELLYFTQ